MLRELDRDSQSQFVFLAFLRIPMLHELSLLSEVIRSHTQRKVIETETDPNTETRTMLALQRTNLCESQCGLVPNLGFDGDFDFVRAQRIRVILVKFDPAVGKRTVRIEEEGAIGKRKLESGIGSVLRPAGTTTRPVWVMGFVGMMRLMRMVRLVRVVGLVGVAWPIGVIWPVRMVRFAGKVIFSGRFMRMTWFARMIGLGGMVRMVRGLGPIRAMGRPAVAVRARRFDLLRLGPIGILVALKFLVGTETNLKSL